MTIYYYVDSNNLYHYGVKGMKWGVRNKQEYKVAKRYAKAGRLRGEADYLLKKAKESSSKDRHNASVLDKQAKVWDRQGKHLRAELARKASQKLKDRANASETPYKEQANDLMNKASRLEQKASAYATKKRVDLGKSKIDKILKSSRKESLAKEQEAEGYRNWQTENGYRSEDD